jgi:hypothetical protein
LEEVLNGGTLALEAVRSHTGLLADEVFQGILLVIGLLVLTRLIGLRR